MRLHFLASVFALATLANAAAQDRISATATLQARYVDSFASLKRLAEQTVQETFAPKPELPSELASLSYNQYQSIQFRPDKGVWYHDGLPFWLETFHRGFVQRDRITLSVLEGGTSKRIPFSTSNFTYESPLHDQSAIADSGHAGFKVAGRFPGQSDGQEMLTFLGSSYFRARSAETLYGASARGLAVNIAMNQTEEFPFFRAFWVARPDPSDETIQILALMDSPSVVGAYQFDFQPGNVESGVEIRCSLYFRSVPEKIGIAPLTSMWMWGDGLKGPAKDARPSVHDSDGLLVRSDQGWTWRAFARQSYPSVSRFEINELRGFGLLQRNRAFYHYDDHNAHYEKRPSVYVQPHGDWGPGTIELLELHGAHEGVDNIAAYWIPQTTPSTDTSLDLRYKVSFFPGDHGSERGIARATDLSIDRSGESITVKVRFSGDSLKGKSSQATQVVATTTRGKLVSKSLDVLDSGDWSVSLDLEPTEKAPIEIILTLMHYDERLSERFTYLCPPEEPEFVYPAVYTRTE